jgi:hypothetical protein
LGRKFFPFFLSARTPTTTTVTPNRHNNDNEGPHLRHQPIPNPKPPRHVEAATAAAAGSRRDSSRAPGMFLLCVFGGGMLIIFQNSSDSFPITMTPLLAKETRRRHLCSRGCFASAYHIPTPRRVFSTQVIAKEMSSPKPAVRRAYLLLSLEALLL